ncbi:ABC transporter ATP-binding protein, partial [Mycobacterium tuberculosis]|nr:ABC transporter ATP-binding protein [Mycobacterium tuberculosis]
MSIVSDSPKPVAKNDSVRVDTWDACVDFPIFDAKTRSLKKSVLGAAGGVIGANASNVVVVEALKNINLHP